MSHLNSFQMRESVRKAASDWIARRDAGLSVVEESEFQAWREADSRHREALARYEKLWSHLDRPRAAGASPQLNRDLALLRQRERRRRSRVMGSASLLVLICGAAWWTLHQYAVMPSAAAEAVVVMVPEHRTLTDGTVVEFPAGSAIAVDFSSPNLRRVTLIRGEAHFQVAKNPARPFVVRAAGVDIEAVGTTFSVQMAKSGLEVLVIEGRVVVDQSPAGVTPTRQSGQPPPRAPTYVDAGQKLSVALNAVPNFSSPQVETISSVEIDQRLAWRNPRMEFSNAPLQTVIAAINRYAAERGGMQFTITDSVLESTRLSGIFRVDDASAFVGILEKGFGIEAERLGEQTIILHKGR